MEKLILVNKKDRPIGIGEKLEIHRQGKLHRCFSILIFNSKEELLIQQRAITKHHSPGLWSNTCCSHPRPNEVLKEAAQRRLKEEMGIESDLKEIFSFIYRAKSGRWIEYEFDHVFLGKFDGGAAPKARTPTPPSSSQRAPRVVGGWRPKSNKKEVKNWKWISLKELEKDIKENPKKYTFWFKKILALYGKQF